MLNTSTPEGQKSRRSRKSVPISLPQAVRGVLVGITDTGEAIVDFCGNSAKGAVSAISTLPLRSDDIGREAILLFEDGDPCRPIIVGLVQSTASIRKSLDIQSDGRKVTFSAEQEITLRCGDASITLTKAGKVVIRGVYILSRSSGPNKVQGGSVQLN